MVSAHQMMLAVASPFLKQLFQAAGLDKIPAGVQDHEPLQLVLPEVKTSLVQALLHFLYTGNVVTQEGQFYSLMKLVYALNINASIEAESTPDSPTLFNTLIRAPGGSASQLNTAPPTTCTCGGGLPSKTGKFDLDSENNLLNSISFNKVTNGLAVNSFTASGVVVKEEMEEKPSFLSDLVDDKNLKSDFGNLLQEPSSQANSNNNNNNNNNQLGHFVSVNPGFQVIQLKFSFLFSLLKWTKKSPVFIPKLTFPSKQSEKWASRPGIISSLSLRLKWKFPAPSPLPPPVQ